MFRRISASENRALVIPMAMSEITGDFYGMRSIRKNGLLLVGGFKHFFP